MSKLKKQEKKGQAAIEYFLLLSLVAVLVLFGFKNFLPQSQIIANQYFQKASRGISGPCPADPGICLGTIEPKCGEMNSSKCGLVHCGGCGWKGENGYCDSSNDCQCNSLTCDQLAAANGGVACGNISDGCLGTRLCGRCPDKMSCVQQKKLVYTTQGYIPVPIDVWLCQDK